MYEFSDNSDNHKEFSTEKYVEYYSKLPNTKENADFARIKEINPKIDDASLTELLKDVNN